VTATILDTRPVEDLHRMVLEDNLAAIPCDNAEHKWCQKGEARWVALVKCPACLGSAHRLWDAGCKDFLMVTGECFECARCGVVDVARHFIGHLEPINRRPR
jgi:hypothetical protein